MLPYIYLGRFAKKIRFYPGLIRIRGQATEILDRGCNGFIQKPFNMEQLSQKIGEILDTK